MALPHRSLALLYLPLTLRAALPLLALGTACHRGQDAKDSGPDAVRIGVITAITGTQAAFGQAHQRGYALALEEINAEGGVLGKPMSLDTYDDQSKPDIALQGASKLVDQDHVPIVLGSYSSESSLALVPTMTRKQVPLVMPTATADNVMEQKSEWVFRLCAGSGDYAAAMVGFLKSHGAPRTLAIIHEDTNFGQSNATAMRKAATASGMMILDEESYGAGSPSYSPMLQRVKAKGPEILYFASYLLDATTLMRQSRQVGINPRFFTAAGTGFSAAEFPTDDKGAGKDAEYTIAASQWVPQVKWPGSKEFDEKFVAKYGAHPGYHAVQAYAALKVAAAAINQAKVAEPAAIRDSLRKVHLESAFGPIHFAENGQNPHPVVITQVQKGKHVVVWPEGIAVAPVLDTPPWSAR
ncbi:MAG TPA: ABC transporter substrate-binding protein [Polyangiaceae bacterium]|jgi:branched-chain amino acid transport system substrate-binding protein|nr:ABC transporter substrate-binding protein [Polyangiaceae bacterium]